jgi:uncharacterized protein
VRFWRGRRIPQASNLRINPPGFPQRTSFFALLFCVACVLLIAGCAKKAPSKAELRGVTSEIVSSAQKIASHKSEITIRPQIQASQAGKPAQYMIDHIYVSVADAQEAQAIEQSVDGIARRHKLKATRTTSGGVAIVDLVSGGTPTHSIHIVTPIARQAGTTLSPPGGPPRLAIIVDDLGVDRGAAEALLALPFPLTVSVIPHLPHSSEIAEEAFRRGDQVLLHLPMEAESETRHESVELRVGMSSQQVESALSGMLDTVPHAVGVNNHQGSRATADATLMLELMPALRQRRLFFIDSRTTTATVAYDVAENSGVRAASRKVFLDDTPTKEAVSAQLRQAARDATRNGFAIAIGHPHPATMAALGSMLPELESRGIRLVFASDVVQ